MQPRVPLKSKAQDQGSRPRLKTKAQDKKPTGKPFIPFSESERIGIFLRQMALITKTKGNQRRAGITSSDGGVPRLKVIRVALLEVYIPL